MKRKLLEVFIGLIVPVLCVAVVGLLFTAIPVSNRTFVQNWWLGAKVMYWLVGAPCHAGFALRVLLRIDVDYAYGFGIALYYGTLFLGRFVGNLMVENEWSYVTAFVIVALVCYIFWLKSKQEE